VILRRGPFSDVISRQLDVFAADNQDVIGEAAQRFSLYGRSDRDDAEELYGDYIDAIETATEVLADMRDDYARNIEEGPDEEYEAAFNRAVAKRWPMFALEIENR
jgi:hypothetical protein